MKAIVEANPFANVATTSSNLCVTFLSAAPTKPEVAPIHAEDWVPELFKVAGKEGRLSRRTISGYLRKVFMA
jgi:hypothetical protein